MTYKLKALFILTSFFLLFAACKEKGDKYGQLYCNSFVQGTWVVSNINTLSYANIALPQIVNDSILHSNRIYSDGADIQAIHFYRCGFSIWQGGSIVPTSQIDSIEIFLTRPAISTANIFDFDTIALARGGDFSPVDSNMVILDMADYNLVNIYKEGQPIRYFAKIKFNSLSRLGNYTIDLKTGLMIDARL